MINSTLIVLIHWNNSPQRACCSTWAHYHDSKATNLLQSSWAKEVTSNTPIYFILLSERLLGYCLHDKLWNYLWQDKKKVTALCGWPHGQVWLVCTSNNLPQMFSLTVSNFVVFMSYFLTCNPLWTIGIGWSRFVMQAIPQQPFW
jgi:hypothetical protein